MAFLGATAYSQTVVFHTGKPKDELKSQNKKWNLLKTK
jgi:hypothetical protein